MKKGMITFVVSVLFAVCLSGCGLVPVRVQEGGSAAGTEEISDEKVIYLAKLPEQYFISYEVAGEDGVVETISKAVDLQGNIYYKNEKEYLFIWDGSNYILYFWEDGKPTEQTEKNISLFISKN